MYALCCCCWGVATADRDNVARMEGKLRMILSRLLLPEHVALDTFILELFRIEEQICVLQSLHSTPIGYERC